MLSKRSKYSLELKFEIVQKYLHGNQSLGNLSEEYYVSKGDIQKWRDAYLEHGIEGLNPSTKSYTGDFKIYVVEYRHKTGMSLRKTAAYFNIPCRNSITEWERIYKEQGKQALYINMRGRVKSLKPRKQRKVKKTVTQNDALL